MNLKRTEQKVLKFISQNELIEIGDKLLIALSGGPDSVFALHFFTKFQLKYKINLEAVHFNHNLRGKESDADQKFCEVICRKSGIPLSVVQLNVNTFAKSKKMSIEEAARKLRYDYLQMIFNEQKCSKIVTAHNQSDNTETILLNFFSGTGISGFSGIPIKRRNIVRPLLCLSKKEIVEYLELNKIPYRFDSSNLSNNYKRNFLRNEIIPRLKQNLNPSIDDAIFRSSKNLDEGILFINEEVNKNGKKYSKIENGELQIKSSLFASNKKWIAGEILKKLLKESFNHEFDSDDFTKILTLVESQKGRLVQLSSKLFAARENESIKIYVKKNDPNYCIQLKTGDIEVIEGNEYGIIVVSKNEVKFGETSGVEFISADKLDDMFILRKWKSGDKFIPLGMKKFKKVSDFLTDLKIETTERKNWFILSNRNNIVWIPGLRIDDRFKITNETNKILKIWKK